MDIFFCIIVPPVIIESLTSNDMVVREGTNVTLTCKAKGFPEPYVMWRREDGDEMAISGENGEIFFTIKMCLFCLTSIIVCFFSHFQIFS